MSAALLSRIDGVPMGSLLNVIGLGSLAASLSLWNATLVLGIVLTSFMILIDIMHPVLCGKCDEPPEPWSLAIAVVAANTTTSSRGGINDNNSTYSTGGKYANARLLHMYSMRPGRYWDVMSPPR